MTQWIGSPNYTASRLGQKVKYIVIHWIVGNLASADAVFQRKGGVSAHYGLENATRHQYVREDHTAYHAGNWLKNLQSIGIEHSAQPGRPASEATYKNSIELCTYLCKKYGLNPDTQIIPHNSIVATQCPGTMDLNKIKRGVKAGLAVKPPAPKPAPKPTPKPKPVIRKVTITVPVANVRKQPTTASPLSGSKTLKKGDVFTSVGLVKGQNVQGNPWWHRSSFGNHVWAGNTNVKK